MRALLHKVEKALDQGNMERAKLRAEIVRLKEDFRAVKPYIRKRVRIPANDKFTTIKDIAEAEEASRKPPKRKRGARTEDLAPVVEKAQEIIIHGLNRIHQIEEID